MAELLRQRWRSTIGGLGMPRRDARACDYDAYVPDRLVGREIVLPGDVAADVADAERAIAALNHTAVALVETEALARILLRAEAVASSRIEGLEVGARRLLHADALRAAGSITSDVTAREVLNNIDAMVSAVERAATGDRITLELLLEVHAQLLAGTRLGDYGGKLRDEQNWIGGSDYNPCSAGFVPPPPELVPELIDDLCSFCNEESLPAVAQAAIAHAQFETIHPFVDGNGRTGRALIHMILRRRGLVGGTLPPISLVLATRAGGYLRGLTAFRYLGSPSSAGAVTGLSTWLGEFAAACTRSVSDALQYEASAADLQGVWRQHLGRVRANSATDLLLRALPGTPVLTVDSAARTIGRTFKPANAAVGRLVEAGILRQVNVGRRNRAYEAPDVIAAFTALERQFATPDADTSVSRPRRPVPQRPRSPARR